MPRFLRLLAGVIAFFGAIAVIAVALTTLFILGPNLTAEDFAWPALAIGFACGCAFLVTGVRRRGPEPSQ